MSAENLVKLAVVESLQANLNNGQGLGVRRLPASLRCCLLHMLTALNLSSSLPAES